MTPNDSGGKSDLEVLLKRRPATLVGMLMTLAVHSLMLSLAIDFYCGTRGMARFFGVQAIILALDIVPIVIVAVERWHGDGQS